MDEIESNAFDLYKEAEALRKISCNKRACFLLITAIEELAKSVFIKKIRFPKRHSTKAKIIKNYFLNHIKKEKIKQEEKFIRNNVIWTQEEYELIFDELIALALANNDEILISEMAKERKSKLENLQKKTIKILGLRNGLLYHSEKQISETQAAEFYSILNEFWHELTKNKNY